MDDAKRIIVDTINRTMPSAAIASGWVSPVNVSHLVAAAIVEHPFTAVIGWTLSRGANRDCTLGLSWVRQYCDLHGLPVSDMFVKPYRIALLKAAMRADFHQFGAA